MEKGFIVGIIKKRMMVSGAMVLSTVTECGGEAKETRISDSGSRTKHMDTEFTSGQMVTNTRVNGTNVFATAKAPTDLQMATASLGITHSAKLTATASIVGQTATSTVAFSKTTWCLEKALGRNKSPIQTQTCTRASMLTIKNTASANSDGRLGDFIEVITSTIWSKATERCNGLMEAFTEALGIVAFKTA